MQKTCFRIDFLASVTEAEVIDTFTSLLRRFFGLKIYSSIMIILITVETNNITHIFASYARNIGDIDLGNWNGIKIILSLLVFQVTLVLPLHPSFFVRSFSALKMVKKGRFLSLDLRFFKLRVFYKADRGTSFTYNSVCWPETSRTVLIYLLSGSARPE